MQQQALWDVDPVFDVTFSLDPTLMGPDETDFARGALVDELPISENVVNKTGGTLGTFGFDFFNRIHASARTIDLGNVVGNQTFTFDLWNAFAYGLTVTSLDESGLDGVELSGVGTPPVQFLAFEELVYTITVTADGPPALDAILTWHFSDGETRTLEILGRRVIGWAFSPDWSQGLVERLEWNTDVLRSYNGHEQRRKKRIGARRGLEFDFTVQAANFRRFETTLFGWQARVFAVPLWWDERILAVDLPIGSSSIAVDTTFTEFAAGGLALIRSTDVDAEVISIDSITDSSITLARATLGDWPAGSRIYPAALMRLAQTQQISRWDGETSYLRAQFLGTTAALYAADGGATTYLGYPVLTVRASIDGDLTVSYDRVLDTLDNGIAPPVLVDQTGIPLGSQHHGFAAHSRADVAALRKLLYYLAGRYAAVWVPTWTSDVVPTVTIANGAANIDVEAQGYPLYVNAAPGRNHLRVELTDNSVLYFKVTGSSTIDSVTERLTISPVSPQNIPLSTIRQVSFMRLMRLDADAVELLHWTGQDVYTEVDFRSFRYDV
jgi:hypothetical protein